MVRLIFAEELSIFSISQIEWDFFFLLFSCPYQALQQPTETKELRIKRELLLFCDVPFYMAPSLLERDGIHLSKRWKRILACVLASQSSIQIIKTHKHKISLWLNSKLYHLRSTRHTREGIWDQKTHQCSRPEFVHSVAQKQN